LVTTDLLVEGIHFDVKTAAFEDIGYKAAVANLSDIAAMGGSPRYVLSSIAVPASWTAGQLERLYRGLMQACRPYHVELVGGDTSASGGEAFLSISVIGGVDAKRVLTRDGARIGDLLYVTGTLGDSLAGFQLLTGSNVGRASSWPTRISDERYLCRRHLRPSPRIREGQLLSRHRLATAAIDLSDGLSGDLVHVCRQSGVGALVDAALLPISSACRSYAEASHQDPVELAMKGGEDYELLFTLAPTKATRFEQLRRLSGMRAVCIGEITPKASGLRLRGIQGRTAPLRTTSYRHFHSPS
jgi:thiamine-monophosphate kinase